MSGTLRAFLAHMHNFMEAYSGYTDLFTKRWWQSLESLLGMSVYVVVSIIHNIPAGKPYGPEDNEGCATVGQQ